MPDFISSWLRWVVEIAMGGAVFGALVIGVLFFFKRSQGRVANRIYGTFLLLLAGMQTHFLLAYGGWLNAHHEWRFLPIYFSLSLPVLFFYYVKLILYPKYRIKSSDTKHFILPLGQLLYLFAIWWFPPLRTPEGRYFYNPFYGGLEQALFISLFPLYIVFSYQYFRRRRRQLRAHSLPRTLWYVHKLIKGAMFFVLAYAILGLSDFFVHKFLRMDLMELPWFSGLSALSFTAMVFFFTVYGFQVLLWGRKLLRLHHHRTKPPVAEAPTNS